MWGTAAHITEWERATRIIARSVKTWCSAQFPSQRTGTWSVNHEQVQGCTKNDREGNMQAKSGKRNVWGRLHLCKDTQWRWGQWNCLGHLFLLLFFFLNLDVTILKKVIEMLKSTRGHETEKHVLEAKVKILQDKEWEIPAAHLKSSSEYFYLHVSQVNCSMCSRAPTF